MITLDFEPLAESVEVTSSELRVRMKDGRALIVPLSWLPRLLHATDEERANWVIIGNGYGIEWPDLDEHVLVEGLFAGRRSQESEKSVNRWLKTRR